MDHAKGTKKKRWVYETKERIICGTTVEEKEVYDKGVILVIY